MLLLPGGFSFFKDVLVLFLLCKSLRSKALMLIYHSWCDHGRQWFSCLAFLVFVLGLYNNLLSFESVVSFYKRKALLILAFGNDISGTKIRPTVLLPWKRKYAKWSWRSRRILLFKTFGKTICGKTLWQNRIGLTIVGRIHILKYLRPWQITCVPTRRTRNHKIYKLTHLIIF